MAAHPDPADTDAFISHILQRYHAVHRAELPGLVQQAQALHASGLAPALSDALRALEEALEQHLFKEEARVFPMMQQGGNTLLHHLMADMEADHRQHEARVASLQALLARAHVDGQPAAHQALAHLQQGVAKLLADLQEHVRLEDELLFPRHRPQGRP